MFNNVNIPYKREVPQIVASALLYRSVQLDGCMQTRPADNFRLDVPRAQALPSFLQTEYFPDNVLIIFAKLRTKNAINYWVGEAA